MSKQRYTVIERIDSGGMAEVFRGKSISIEGFEKTVAIKRILPNLTKNDKFVGMFLDEAKLCLFLNHANIVQVFDVGRSNDTYFIVMEFINGTNLKKVIEEYHNGKAFPVPIAVYIAMEVCKALVHAHEKKDPNGKHLNIVHRDVSPPNILISTEGEVKVVDFGLAKAASQIEHTEPGVVKGKFAYLSPEVARGEEVDLRADVFALGIVLWEMLAGRRLFVGKTDLETLENIRRCKIPSLMTINSNVPPELDQLVIKALECDRENRISSAVEMSDSLANVLFGYGMKVTAFDLAALAKKSISGRSRPSAVEKSVIGELIKDEMAKFISIDDMGQKEVPPIGSQPLDLSELSDNPLHNVMDFEDSRTWGKNGKDEQESGFDPFDQQRQGWKEVGLDGLAGALENGTKSGGNGRKHLSPNNKKPLHPLVTVEPDEDEEVDDLGPSRAGVAKIIFGALLGLIVVIGVLIYFVLDGQL